MVADAVDLKALLADLDDIAKTELASSPEVADWGGTLEVSTLPIEARKWIRVPDVVAVVADLKNSTRLGTGKKAASTARIYQAATGGVVDVLNEFGADFFQIQGDGAFGLFWGEARYERALCAGVTIKTYSQALIERMDAKWPGGPTTGFKVGVASSRILVKRIGVPRHPDKNEPVWAGKAVNYAAKAAQQVDRHEMLVTASVWNAIEKNDYLAISCPCGTGPSATLWTETTIDKVPEEDDERHGRLVKQAWCNTHGPDYCAAILAGLTQREDAEQARAVLTERKRAAALEAVRAQTSIDLRNHHAGLRR